MSTPNSATAVLLMAYGSPETAADVAPYYTHIRGGQRPPEERIKELETRYAFVGGKTPLRAITNAQAAGLQRLLDEREGPGRFRVFVGMKHWHPFIKQMLGEIRQSGIRDVIAIALAPHFSKMSIGGYEKALAEDGHGLNIRIVRSWNTNGTLIDCIVTQTKEALANSDGKRPHIVFTAHSLPERIREWNDPYEEQLLETCRLVAARLPGYDWSFSFQSAGHTADPWLGPDIAEALADLKAKGTSDVLVCPIGFVADHLEILFDLDKEAKEAAERLRMRLARVESRNSHPLFLAALYDLTRGGVADEVKLAAAS
jgi:ferrochelatase